MNKKTWLALILLTVIGFTIRAWKISTLPFPPDGDEIAFGYYGWSLLHSRTDEFSNKFPLFFSSIGDYKYPGLAYLNIIPAAIFGLSDITTRFWSVLSSTIAIPLIFLLSYFFTKSNTASIFAALIFTFSPWSIIESRLGYENHISFVITLMGTVSLFAYFGFINLPSKLAKSKKYLFAVSILLFLISIFTYGAQRLFIPLFLFCLLLFSFFNKEFAKVRARIFFVFIALSIASFSLFLNPNFRGRAGEEIWKVDSDVINSLTRTYTAAGISPIKIPPRLTYLAHNKYSSAVIEFSSRYWSHFSPEFLFFKGDAGDTNDEGAPGMGVLLFAEMILLPIGTIAFLKNKNSQRGPLLFIWLLTSPLPSTLTRGSAHINRASLMIIPLSILSGYGLLCLTSLKQRVLKYSISTVIHIFIAWSVLYTLHQLFLIKPTLNPWYKQQVNKQMTEKVLALKNRYDAVAVRDDDYIFFLFYSKISPKEFQSRSKILSPAKAKWQRVDQLDNIFFKMPFRCPLSGKERVLYVCEGDEIPQNSKLIDIVYYGDHLPAYTFIEFYPLSKRPHPLPPLPERLKYMVGTEKPDGNPDGIISPQSPSLW